MLHRCLTEALLIRRLTMIFIAYFQRYFHCRFAPREIVLTFHNMPARNLEQKKYVSYRCCINKAEPIRNQMEALGSRPPLS